MATAAVIGLSTGKRFLSSSFCHPDLAEKLFPVADRGSLQFLAASPRSTVVARKSSHFGTNGPPTKHAQAVKALKESVHTLVPSSSNAWSKGTPNNAKEDLDFESSLEVLILLQKSMLEKQWELPFDQMTDVAKSGESCQMPEVARSGVSARQRRVNARRRCFNPRASIISLDRSKKLRPSVSPELLRTKLSGYVKGSVSDNLLTHAEVVNLSNKIKVGLCLEEHRAKLKDKLGSEPCDKQLAFSLRMSLSELRSKLLECSLAREKLAMSNVRLVMSVAQKYDNLGAEMADLIQGGLIGLLRGIEKFDSSKGFRISTYVYWWIRQGVSRALVENSRTLRLPMHLHERLSSIRNAKIRLEGRGITPSITNLAESLNMSQKKVRNATEAVSKVISLDREAFPSLNGLPGESLHSYIADKNLDNNPWHGFDEWALKDEINKLLLSTLTQRESDII